MDWPSFVKIVKGTFGIRGVEPDSLVKSIPTTGTFHHLGHEGKVFVHSDNHSIAASVGAIFDILIKVPASPTTRQVHMRFNYTVSEIPCVLELYRDTAVSADGTPETINSSNDAVVKTTGVQMFSAPTIIDAGNLWPISLFVGEKRSGGSAEQLVPEYVLAPGVNYLLRLINNSGKANTVNNAIFFYDNEAA